MNKLKNKSMIYLISTALSMLILTGCATAQTEDTCPTNPKLAARVPLGKTFQPRIQDFLQGKLPEQTQSEQPSKPATTTRTQ